jgi:hypothetical protein
MNRLEKYQREHLENLAEKKAELYNEHLDAVKEEEQIAECQDTLIGYMGLDEFKKLSKDNLQMIIGAMREYAENSNKNKYTMSTMIRNLNPVELSKYLSVSLRNNMIDLLMEFNKRDIATDSKPHYTRFETAKFFNVTPNCINDWVKKGILTPMKIGQRVYFSKNECVKILFEQIKTK